MYISHPLPWYFLSWHSFSICYPLKRTKIRPESRLSCIATHQQRGKGQKYSKNLKHERESNLITVLWQGCQTGSHPIIRYLKNAWGMFQGKNACEFEKEVCGNVLKMYTGVHIRAMTYCMGSVRENWAPLKAIPFRFLWVDGALGGFHPNFPICSAMTTLEVSFCTPSCLCPYLGPVLLSSAYSAVK